MGTTKFVLFIVEGETDELALGRALTSLFASGEHPGPRFGIVRGDITSVHALGAGNPASTIKKRLVDAVKEFLAKDKLRVTDLDAIVLLSDTDGAFIDDSLVVYDEDEPRCSYYEDRIETSNVASLRQRNQCKSSCLKTLSRTHELTCNKRKIPFKAAYMSRNLEHALSDYSGRATQQKKYDLARKFSKKYGTDVIGFLELLALLAPVGSYQDSWVYIAQDNNSLLRGSNMKQTLEALPSSLIETASSL